MEVFKLLGTIALNKGEVVTELKEVESAADKTSGRMQGSFGKIGNVIGSAVIGGLAAAGTAVVAFGAKGVQAAKDFEQGMANVGTLIEGDRERMEELGDSVLDLTTEIGKPFEDLQTGLYQVISAFGDSEQSMETLEVAAKAASAGLSSTEASVNLLAAAIKGYGLEQEDAQQVADFAFQTVKLGQTTYDELAATMGRVIPLASTLNVRQEELWGTVATLTGVTGNTAEVTTQLRATYQAILRPTEDMKSAMSEVAGQLIDQGKLTGEAADIYRMYQQQLEQASQELRVVEQAYGSNSKEAKAAKERVEELEKALDNAVAGMGPAIVESIGFQEALALLADEAGGNNAVLAKMFGSVESLNAVLALTGPQADTWTEKIGAMGESSGAASEAFEVQSDTFETSWNKFQAVIGKLQVQIGQVLLPILNDLLQFFLDNWPQIEAVVTAVFDGIAGFMAEHGDEITTIITSLWDTVSSIVKGAVDLIEGYIKYFSAFFRGDIEGMQEAGVQIFNALWDTVSSIFENALNILDSLTGGWITRIKDSVTNGIQGIIDFVTNIPQNFKEGAQNLLDAFIEGVIEGARKIPLLGNMIANKLSEYLVGESPPPKGPLSHIDEGGYNVISAWAQGIEQASPLAVEAARKIAEDTRRSFEKEMAQLRGDDAKLFDIYLNEQVQKFQEAGWSQIQIIEWVDAAVLKRRQERLQKEAALLREWDALQRDSYQRIVDAVNQAVEKQKAIESDYRMEMARLRGDEEELFNLQLNEEVKKLQEAGWTQIQIREWVDATALKRRQERVRKEEQLLKDWLAREKAAHEEWVASYTAALERQQQIDFDFRKEMAALREDDEELYNLYIEEQVKRFQEAGWSQLQIIEWVNETALKRRRERTQQEEQLLRDWVEREKAAYEELVVAIEDARNKQEQIDFDFCKELAQLREDEEELFNLHIEEQVKKFQEAGWSQLQIVQWVEETTLKHRRERMLKEDQLRKEWLAQEKAAYEELVAAHEAALARQEQIERDFRVEMAKLQEDEFTLRQANIEEQVRQFQEAGWSEAQIRAWVEAEALEYREKRLAKEEELRRQRLEAERKAAEEELRIRQEMMAKLLSAEQSFEDAMAEFIEDEDARHDYYVKKMVERFQKAGWTNLQIQQWVDAETERYLEEKRKREEKAEAEALQAAIEKQKLRAQAINHIYRAQLVEQERLNQLALEKQILVGRAKTATVEQQLREEEEAREKATQKQLARWNEVQSIYDAEAEALETATQKQTTHWQQVQRVLDAKAEALGEAVEKQKARYAELDRIYDEQLAAEEERKNALINATTARYQAMQQLIDAQIEETAKREKALYELRKALGDVSVQEEMSRMFALTTNMRAQYSERLTATQEYYEWVADYLEDASNEEKQQVLAALQTQLAALDKTKAGYQVLFDVIQRLSEQATVKVQSFADRFSQTWLQAAQSIGNAFEQLTIEVANLFLTGTGDWKDILNKFLSAAINAIITAAVGAMGIAKLVSQALANMWSPWGWVVIGGLLIALAAIQRSLSSSLQGVSGGSNLPVNNGGGSGAAGGDETGSTSPGHQISEVTGPTRDLLVDLLTPLASLDSLVGIGNRIFELLDARLPFMGQELALAGAGTTSVQIGQIAIYPAEGTAESISEEMVIALEEELSKRMSFNQRGVAL